MSTLPVFKIIPTAQKYDWGKIGTNSKVAQFASASKIPGFTLEESAPYAEVLRLHAMRVNADHE
jgi:mannose-6-phosphate isomerase